MQTDVNARKPNCFAPVYVIVMAIAIKLRCSVNNWFSGHQ